MKQMITSTLCALALFFCNTAASATSINITDISSFAESCLNAQNGYLIITAECGSCTGALEYSTDNTNFQSSNILTDLAGGSYTVYVRDAVNTSCATSQMTSIQAGTVACDDCDNPMAQLKLVASDAAEDNEFGRSVSISENYAIVGATRLLGDNLSAAYIFERDINGAWNEVQKLTASDAAAGDNFGFSVSISGDYAIVGSFLNDDKGSAYIFERNMSGTWNEVQKLTASDGAIGDWFGENVSISGDYAIVGAHRDDDDGNASGSAYVFERNMGGAWSQVQKLTASDAAADDAFGWSVAISGNYAVIESRDYAAANTAGSAYVFERNMSGAWNEVQKLTASDAAALDSFGSSVAISGNYIIVGAYGNDDNGSSSGSAYIFERNMGGTWNQVQKITASDAATNDRFGYSVSISGNYAIVGAYLDDDDGTNSGSAYVFERNMGGTWNEVQKLTASDAASSDRFGESVSISGNYTIVGADGNDDNGFSSGSAYINSCTIALDNVIVTGESCTNVNDGSITITASGAIDIEYSIENGIWQSSNSFTGLGEGTYTVKVRNVNNPTCTAVCNAEIIDENLISITQIDATDESCLNAQDGYLIVTAECGTCTGALEYSTDNTNFQSSNTFTDLAGGSNTVYVRDAANTSCSTSQMASLQASTEACDDCDNPSAAALAQLKLVASDASADDRFGLQVSISGKYAIVGAFFNDDDGTDSGSAYIFEQDASGAWNEVQKLTASDAALDDIFGSSVSISSDYAIIGAYRDDGYTGSVYVFQRNMSGTWNEIQKLTASDAASGDRFGVSSSISGDYAIIGASTNDDDGSSSGSAYIFERNTSGTWNEVQKLTASDAAAADVFGRFVSISGGNAIVSAYQDDDDGNDSGSAYIFERDMSGTWNQVQKLTASDAAADDRFGFSVSIAGEEAVVGAYQDDDGGSASGSAYVFKRDMSGTWNQVQKLTASDAAADDFFGYSVSITECNIAVGAYQDDDGSSNSGSAYIFERNTSGTWNEIQKLNASDAAADDRFGLSIVLSGNNAIIGADLNDDGGSGSGSAYIQDISCFIALDDIIAVNESCAEADDGSITITASGASDIEYSIESGIWQSSGSFTGLDEGTYTVKVRNVNKPTCTAVCTAVIIPVPTCVVSISPKVFLQGPLVGTVMADQLRINSLIPHTEPYTALGYTYVGGGGGETVAASVFTITGGMAVIDWVIVELRDATTPTSIVESRAALLLSNGNVVDVDGISAVTLNSPSGSYYVAIRHRNHLGVMTNTAVFLD